MWGWIRSGRDCGKLITGPAALQRRGVLKLAYGAKQLTQSGEGLGQLGLGLEPSWTVESQRAGHTQTTYVGISSLEPGISRFQSSTLGESQSYFFYVF